MIPLVAFVGSLLASFGAGFIVRRLLQKWRILDSPTTRSSHMLPTLRGGGIGIMIVILAGGALIVAVHRGRPEAMRFAEIAALAGLLAVVSFRDDVRSLSPALRLGCHSAAGVLALIILRVPLLETASGQGIDPTVLRVFGFAVFFVWLVGYTNAFNFMDGINGIAAGQATITGLGMAVLPMSVSDDWTSEPVLAALIVAGAAAGFLPHNFPRARMFMGDVGSAPLGFLLAALALWLARVYGWQLLVPLALMHANFVLDTAITLLRRIAARECWYEAHREHFYQRLVRAGKSHTFVSGMEMSLQAVVLLLMTAYVRVGWGLRISLTAFVLLIWISFYVYCEYAFRRSLAKPLFANSAREVFNDS